jgi:hypothetical protein
MLPDIKKKKKKNEIKIEINHDIKEMNEKSIFVHVNSHILGKTESRLFHTHPAESEF